MERSRIEGAEGARALLLGNEAVARGALEAGVGVAAGYPGTPSSEIVQSLIPVAASHGMHVEWSVNEKVALEVAAGASYAGARALVTMKHVGLNVAADPFLSLVNTGLRGGLVVAVGDDPGMHSSQNEQDSRQYARFAKSLCLVPSGAQEAKDLTVAAFEASERLGLPVLLRLTTRVCHTREPVALGAMKGPPRAASFSKDPSRLIMVPAHARLGYRALLDKQPAVAAFVDGFAHNRLEGEGRLGIVASGVAARSAREAASRAGVEAAFLTVATWPPPLGLLRELDGRVERIIVLEEGDPMVEEAARLACRREVRGKLTGDVPFDGEMTVDAALRALGGEPARGCEASEAPPRPPVLCPGCSHRATFHAMRRARCRVVAGDIGCYTLGFQPPLGAIDTCLCMGASISKAAGMHFAGLSERPAAVIGDSTFLHSGVGALMSAVHNGARITVVVLDNSITAMTGHQPHPGTGTTATGSPAPRVSIEGLARECGAPFVRSVDALDVAATVAALEEAGAVDGVAVVVARGPCVFRAKRERRAPRVEGCTGCLACVRSLGCPAILPGEGAVSVDEALCTGCGVCAQVCPRRALIMPQAGGASPKGGSG